MAQPSSVDGATAADPAYSAELVRRVNAEADDATRMPGWFWIAAPVVFVASVAAAAIWPWGVAS